MTFLEYYQKAVTLFGKTPKNKFSMSLSFILGSVACLFYLGIINVVARGGWGGGGGGERSDVIGQQYKRNSIHTHTQIYIHIYIHIYIYIYI
jgi:hypothetical protein